LNPEQLIPQLVIYMVVLLLAISAHEAAHAWMSDRFGDDTARLLGRVTLNPVAHTDLVGTLLIPIVGFILGAMGGGGLPLIGWGKPTPVNPLRWRNKDLAALYFSALDIGLTRRDKLRFLKGYFQQPLRQILREEASLLAWLEGKANKLYERKQRYGDAL